MIIAAFNRGRMTSLFTETLREDNSNQLLKCLEEKWEGVGERPRGEGRREKEKEAGGDGRRGESRQSRIHKAITVRVWGGVEGNKLQDAP